MKIFALTKSKIIFIFVFFFFWAGVWLLGDRPLFLFGKLSASTQNPTKIVISEVLIGTNSADEEFVELYNLTNEDINLAKLPLRMRIVNSVGTDTNKTLNFLDPVIKARSYYLIASSKYYDKYKEEFAFGATYSAGLVANGAVYISTSNSKDKDILDLVCWGSSSRCPSPLENPEKNYSLERTADWLGWQKSFLEGGTPGAPNSQPLADDPDLEEDFQDEEPCPAYSTRVRLSEIFPYPDGGEEFVEIYNAGEECVDVSGWKIMDAAGHKKIFPSDTFIQPKEHLYLQGNLYLNNDSDTVYLLALGEKLKENALDQAYYTRAKKNHSWSFDGEKWRWSRKATPGKENEFESEEREKEKQIDFELPEYNIRLNEIFPNPKGEESEKEYIEIFNGEEFAINLENWMLRDSSQGRFVFPADAVIQPEDYLVVYRSQFKFALNNTGRETIYLLDPDENIISSISYENAKENVSYNFSGFEWRWSRYLTPGKENKFNSLPEIKIKKTKKTFIGLPTFFSVKAKDRDKDKLKFLWEFGNGKRSYLQEVFHTYQKRGVYTVSLTVDDGSEKVTESFKLEVASRPKARVEIIGILPNPPGLDSENEWIELKNNSSKKVNLRGWKIATGRQKLINRNIADDFFLEPNQTRKLTRQDAFFYLNNKAMTLELRYPSGKTVESVSYSKGKIAEGEMYRKTIEGWQWFKPENNEEVSLSDPDLSAEETEENFLLEEGFIQGWESFETEAESKHFNQETLLSCARLKKFIPSLFPNNQKNVSKDQIYLDDSGFYRFTQPEENESFKNRIFYLLFFGK